jgi:DNA-binding response OmpR family regulator
MLKGNGQGKRGLVVEDEPSIARMCLRALGVEGFEVDVASDGKAAQSQLARNGDIYDLCLIDIRTPGMNGIELYQYLKKTGSSMINRVIFTTGDTINEEIKTFLEKTGRPFLPKPFTLDELRSVIKMASVITSPEKSGQDGKARENTDC